MISKYARDRIWQHLLDMARYARYYDRLAAHYCFYRNFSQFILGVSATGVIISFAGILPATISETIMIIIGALIGIATVWDLVYRPGDKAASLTIISQEVNHQEMEYRNLWEKINSGQIRNDEEAMEKSEAILKKVLNACKNDNANNKKLNQKCTEEAYAVEKDRYGT